MGESGDQRKKFAERLTVFAEKVIQFCRTIPGNTVTRPLISQLVRSGTSIGANYMEALCASSRKDFRNKIYICKKESQETEYWLRLMKSAESSPLNIAELSKEVHEFTLIFQKTTATLDKNDK